MPFKHRFTSAVVDANDPDVVGPDEWNDSHQEDPRRGSLVFEECYFLGTSGVYAGGIGQNAAGTSAASQDGFGEVTDPGLGAAGTGVHHPGLVIVATGSTSTGRCGLMATQGLGGGHVLLYGGGVRFGICLRLTSLSDGSQTFTVRCGLNQSATAESSDAVFFRYTHSVNGGEWEGVSRSGGSESGSVLDTNAAPSTTQFQTLEFVLNDDADEIEFFVDGASVGTVTSNISTAVPMSFMPVNIIKSVGNTSRGVAVDAYWYAFDIRSR